MNTLIEQVLAWGIEKGITGPNGKGTKIAQAAKVLEEARETYNAVQVSDLIEIKDGIGDTMVTLILLAEMHGWTAEECLQAAYGVISKRHGAMIGGSFIKSSDLDDDDEPEPVLHNDSPDDPVNFYPDPEDDMDEPLGPACQLGDETCESCQ